MIEQNRNPISLARHDMGLATIIGRNSRGGSSQKINPATRFTMNRLRIMDHRTQGYRPGFNFTKISSYVLS
jgi:transcription initiation factor TFIIB